MRLVPGKPVCYITVVRQSSEGVVNKANSNKSCDRDTNQLSNHWRSRSDAEQTLFFSLTLQSAMQQYYRSDTAHPWKTSCKSRKTLSRPLTGAPLRMDDRCRRRQPVKVSSLWLFFFYYFHFSFLTRPYLSIITAISLSGDVTTSHQQELHLKMEGKQTLW